MLEQMNEAVNVCDLNLTQVGRSIMKRGWMMHLDTFRLTTSVSLASITVSLKVAKLKQSNWLLLQVSQTFRVTDNT